MEFILALGIGITIILIFSYFEDKQNIKWWNEWDKNPKNFSFTYKGRTLWYSRSVAVSLFLFAKDINGNLFVLANKRGKGCPDFNGYWNCICGYLDYNRDSIDQCMTELMEETGLVIDRSLINFWGVKSNPNENKQNVSIRHIGLLENYDINNCQFDLSNMEKDEVEDVKWIPINEINNYEWAFNHLSIIKEGIEYLNK